MAINVRQLYKNILPLYNMKLLAGIGGTSNPVKWICIANDENICDIIRGDEIVIAADAENNSDEWIFSVAKKLHNNGSSALVICLSPYIRQIPQDVIDFCDKVYLPLFTIPFTVRIDDIVNDFHEQIIRSEKADSIMAGAFKNIIFNTGNKQDQLMLLERYGFLRTGKFCLLCISAEDENGSYNSDRIKELQIPAGMAAKEIRDLYITFTYNDKLFIVLSEYTEYDTTQFISIFRRTLISRNIKCCIYIGVSANTGSITEQERNFEGALSANKIAMRQGVTVVYYEKLEIYKLLFAVKETKALQEFYGSILGPLEQYDKVNGTQLVRFLRIFIENNGSQHLIAEKTLVHRNTVTYQIKKIEKITGYNILELKNAVKCSLAFCIRDII